jgi:uncharacterized membrane protein YeaQ/YmgE (transglycosylase-associated protein family)
MTLTVIILFALQGLIIGALARLALPGRDPMSIWATMGIGMLASFVAGLVVYAISDGREAPGFFSAFVVAVLIMYVVRKRRGGGLTDPGGGPRNRTRFSSR